MALSIAVGILVAWLAGKGVPLMGEQPILVTGLLIGTIIGVAFLGGIPVGPLIAAGILALLLGKI
ncbi:permease [Haemophilus influenzae]|nr:permease [Haemophilus influenzae]CWX49131.1 permease [Haemophilus influenzae]